jgi:hypothetical protein
MQPPGRPLALDDEKCTEICDLVTAGHSVAAAARLMGCNVKTIRRHAQRDDRFGRLLRAAELAAQNDPLKLMRRAAGGSWRAAAWLLERTDPERYAKQPTATCRPQDVDRAFTRIMDAALALIRGDAERRAMYQSLAKVMEEETVELFLPPSVRRASPKCASTSYVDQQRLSDLLDSIARPWKPATPPENSAETRDSVPRANPRDPKTQAPQTSSKPGESCQPRREAANYGTAPHRFHSFP